MHLHLKKMIIIKSNVKYVITKLVWPTVVFYTLSQHSTLSCCLRKKRIHLYMLLKLEVNMEFFFHQIHFESLLIYQHHLLYWGKKSMRELLLVLKKMEELTIFMLFNEIWATFIKSWVLLHICLVTMVTSCSALPSS